MSPIIRKPVLCYMRTTKTQVSQRIHAVWSASLLFAPKIVHFLKILQPNFNTLGSFWSQAGWSESYLMAHRRRQVFSWCGSNETTRNHNFALICPINFSSFIASPISPWIFNFPIMNAVVGLISPANILLKSSLSIDIVQPACSGASPCPRAPEPFFISIYHTPSSAPGNEEEMKKHEKVPDIHVTLFILQHAFY